MHKRDEQTPGRNPKPQGDDFGEPDTERERAPGGERDAEEEDEGLE
jgi:hypothetical protein